MAKFIRYAIAAIFFAASVGCLGLCYHGGSHEVVFMGPTYFMQDRGVYMHSSSAGMTVAFYRRREGIYPLDWEFLSRDGSADRHFAAGTFDDEYAGRFGLTNRGLYFPLWYASLIFALAGVGVLRVRRQFSIRSALVGLTVVALLLGMVVAL